MTDVQALQISYVPGCSQQAQYRQYVAADAVAFTPDAGSYYRHKVSVMLPGAIVGAVCLLAALAFLVWVSPTAEPLQSTQTFSKQYSGYNNLCSAAAGPLL